MSSLRSRVILASVLWTAGLLAFLHLLSLLVIHTLPGIQGGHAAVVGTAVGTLLMFAGFAVAWRSLRPLRGIESSVAAIESGQATRVEGTYPAEVQPVIDRLNAMLEEREKAIVRARAVAGDLAHGLKTPLALLSREADLARVGGHAAVADAIATQVRRMTEQVDRHLARARVAVSGPVGSERCLVAPTVEALVRTLSTLHVERAIGIAARTPPDLEVSVRHEDLEEILGNVLDNACKWAQTQVTLDVTAHGTTITFAVEDDGPGLPESARESVLQRGVRLDERAPGSGLGLSIVRDLVEHYRGTITLDSSPLGGLQVAIALPAAPPRL
jgi:signal transduction histidine kinase